MVSSTGYSAHLEEQRPIKKLTSHQLNLLSHFGKHDPQPSAPPPPRNNAHPSYTLSTTVVDLYLDFLHKLKEHQNQVNAGLADMEDFHDKLQRDPELHRILDKANRKIVLFNAKKSAIRRHNQGQVSEAAPEDHERKVREDAALLQYMLPLDVGTDSNRASFAKSLQLASKMLADEADTAEHVVEAVKAALATTQKQRRTEDTTLEKLLGEMERGVRGFERWEKENREEEYLRRRDGMGFEHTLPGYPGVANSIGHLRRANRRRSQRSEDWDDW
ncbi:hypothetical protein T439DRAFT_371205 [Meredithblackwellia eburnea MCA 4105]